MNTVVFAIHTVPDTETGVRKYNLGDLQEKDAIKAIMHLQQQTGADELPPFMQRIAAITTISLGDNGKPVIKSWESGSQSEAEILKQFLTSFDKNSVRLVSWENTSGDLPLLMYRCLKNKASAALLKTCTTLSLKDELSCHQPAAMTTQQNIMDMLGLDYAPVLSIKKIWQYWRKEKYEVIQQSCTNRAQDSYRVFLNYQLMMGEISDQEYDLAAAPINKLIH